MILVKDEVVQGRHAYTVDRLVGAGAYAAVYRVKDELGRVVALKEYFPASHPRDAAQLRKLWEREKYVLSQVSPHPLMPTLYEAFEYNRQLYIAQEFVEGSTLADLIQRYKKLDREWMLKWAVNLCDSLTFLHERSIVHHDLKPANLKITPEGHLFILDYGAAQYFGEPRSDVPEVFTSETELYGTEGYLPPELEEHFVANVQTDIFALGCILYEMVMGVPPEQQRIKERNMAVTTPLTQRRDVDLDYVRIVSTALSFNMEYRYATAQVFLQELRKIAPPVPMVSRKSLYFGTREYSEGDATQEFLIYNSGVQVELNGEMAAKVPWLKIEQSKFRGKRRKVMVSLVPSKVTAFNKPLKGEIDILVSEQRDSEGNIIVRADRWTVVCYAYVRAREAALRLANTKGIGSGEAEEAPVVRGTRGVAGKARIGVVNCGEVSADFTLEPSDKSLGLTLSPSQVHLGRDGQAMIELQYKPGAAAGSALVHTMIVAKIRGEQVSSLPVVLETISAIDFAKAALGFGR